MQLEQLLESTYRFSRQVGLVSGGEFRAAMIEAQKLSAQRGRVCHIVPGDQVSVCLALAL